MGSWALGYRGIVFAKLEVISAFWLLQRVCEVLRIARNVRHKMTVAVYSSGAMATAPLATFGGGAPVEQLHASLASRAGQPACSLAEACEH